MEIAESILNDRNVDDITFITIGQWHSIGLGTQSFAQILDTFGCFNLIWSNTD